MFLINFCFAWFFFGDADLVTYTLHALHGSKNEISLPQLSPSVDTITVTAPSAGVFSAPNLPGNGLSIFYIHF